MYILGLNSHSHDVSSVLIKENKIIFAIEEERLSGWKHHGGFFFGDDSKLSRNYCLNLDNLNGHSYKLVESWNLNKIDSFYRRFKNFSYYPRYFFEQLQLMPNYFRYYNKIHEHNGINHHLSHAASSFRVCNFNKSNILVIDGAGETESSSLFFSSGKDIELIKNYHKLNSLGWLYREMSHLFGFGEFGAGKIMALTGYGQIDKKLLGLINFKGDDYFVNWGLFNRLRKLKLNFKQKSNIATTLQFLLEKTSLKLVKQIYENTGYKTLCLAGGVSLNCKMNSVLLNSDYVNKIFIQPAAHDAGAALGAALELNYLTNDIAKIKDFNDYLGFDYSNEEIKLELRKSRLKFEYYKDIEGVAAELIANGSVIGFFQGRLEFGPRALGNRSILASPSSKEISDKVNKLKHRELWRPLAPAILENKGTKYVKKYHPSPYMTIAFDVKGDKKEEIKGVVHVDGTARIQTVTKKQNKPFYNLLKAYEKITTIPVLLNTSFNDRGQPIVCSPKDAIKTFLKMKLDALVIGNYLVKLN